MQRDGPMTRYNDGAALRARLRRWFTSVPGQLVCEAETPVVRQSLPNLFGYHIVQLGRLDDAELLDASRIPHRVVADVDDDRAQAGVQLVCHPAALPLAADSIDVLVLPHVLEFEDDPYQVLREAERVLIAEGHVIVTGFNPWSLWGLWRLLLAWRGDPPWCGRFFGLTRAKEWLQLLGFDIVGARTALFRPPLRRPRLLRRLAFMEKLGAYGWPRLGGVYCLVGKKRLIPMTPIRARWKTRRRLIAGGLAEPTARRGALSGRVRE